MINEKYLESLSVENACCLMRELSKQDDGLNDPRDNPSIVESVIRDIDFALSSACDTSKLVY